MPGAVELADASAVADILDALAARLRPHLRRDTALIGIVRRGAPLARLLAERLQLEHCEPPAVGELALKRYSDELEVLHQRPRLDAESLDVDVRGRHLILVDDVLFTGESMLRGVCHLRERGAERMQIAVLCARGAARMPIRADFVGLELDVGPNWIVDCHVPPYEDRLAIQLRPHHAPTGAT